ncbi:lysoplasmalogenase family protein [Janibacter sp. GS2]|uniref:lysoplasmalogenase family protein n=1 Tax=Janibacter sp. GS2 TaxID=3442646 RepID=UPI003EBCF927
MPAALVTLAVVTLVHLVAQASSPDGVVADLTQVLLMPVLAWTLITSTPNPKSRLVRLVLLALTLSWLGDTLPRFAKDGSDLGFVLMLGPFLLAQLAYVAAFLPFVSRSIVRTRPLLLAPYALALAVLVAVVAGDAGALLPAVILYGVTILAMAVLATGIDTVATVGAIVFLVSDALIALSAFAGLDLPLHGVWVMLTYIAGQTLLVTAVAHHDRAVAARRA